MYLLLYLALAASAPVAFSPAQAAGLERLTIDTATGQRTFMVEVVREEGERNRGLMFRRSLAADRGMLFDYDPPQQIAFWMKNTYIPLDIIFVGGDGKIITIAANTTPLSLEQIPSGGAARGVLEIAGGVCATLGIKVGDRVHHHLFDSAR